MTKDFTKCNYCGACGQCFSECSDDECLEKCIEVCPQNALKKDA